MKTSLRKLRRAIHRHADAKERGDLRPLVQLDELAQASQDMQDMRDWYDSLLSAAAATANSAYEFSESLREMGTCLLEKTALNDDEESGRVLLMLGKVQFELQKLVDKYRSHIFQTITIPSESLLNELRTVEEMQQQCEEKRNVYEYMIVKHREKGMLKCGKGENFSMQQLQEAHDEYDEEATLCVFRLKSLKQGQSRSLLTQASRHHAAQLCFFKKALKSLETVEPHVKLVSERQHIDYHFSGLEDDDGDEANDEEIGSDARYDGELSFDYGHSDQEQDSVSTARNSMELDPSDLTFPRVANMEATSKDYRDGRYRKSFSFTREPRISSKSAPLFAENKYDTAEKLVQMRTSLSRKFNTYVLPTPDDTKNSNSTVSGKVVQSHDGKSHYMRHSSPLELENHEKILGDENTLASGIRHAESVLKESNNNTTSPPLPPPLLDGLLYSRVGPNAPSEPKKIKRQSFSGPLTSKQWSTKPVLFEPPRLHSGPITRTPIPPRPLSSQKLLLSSRVSPKVSPSGSPTFRTSPKINELHELPRPPSSSTYQSSRVHSMVGHSGPLMPRGQMHYPNKSMMLNSATPLPKPPKAISRSFSIPSRGQEETTLPVNKPIEASQYSEMVETVASPPLTPIALSKFRIPMMSNPEDNHGDEMKGVD